MTESVMSSGDFSDFSDLTDDTDIMTITPKYTPAYQVYLIFLLVY